MVVGSVGCIQGACCCHASALLMCEPWGVWLSNSLAWPGGTRPQPPLARCPCPQPIRRVKLYEPEADRVVVRAPGFRTIRGVAEEEMEDASLLSSSL